MKKVYIAPAIEIVELEAATILAASPGIEARETLDGTSYGGNSKDGGMDAESNRHRGTWGNLWE